MKLKENPPAAHSEAKWRNVRVMLTLARNKWNVGGGGDTMLLGKAGWGAYCAHGLCTPFTLFLFSLYPKIRNINGNFYQGCEGKSISKKLSIIFLRRFQALEDI